MTPGETPLPAVGPRQLVGPDGLRLIRQHDLYNANPYRHRRGFDAIGHAHRLLPGESVPFSRERANACLVNDCYLLAAYLGTLLPAPLPQGAFDALISLLHDIGIKAWESAPVRLAVTAGDHALAVDLWPTYDAGASESVGVSQGCLLALRRRRERELYAAATRTALRAR